MVTGFMGGVGISETLIVLAVLAVPCFFFWKWLLNVLIRKGPMGINLAAALVGALMSPVIVVIVSAFIYFIVISIEERELRQAQMEALEAPMDTTSVSPYDTLNIDVMTVSPDKCKPLLENDYVRVFEYTLAPGEKDNPHTHPPKSYYVVEGGRLRVYPDGGEPFDVDEKQGTAEWGDHIGKHYVENIGATTVRLVVTEVKSASYYY